MPPRRSPCGGGPSCSAAVQGLWLERLAVNIYAAKGRYLWRDLPRICESEGIALKLPPLRFPQNGLKAARLALVGESEGWTPAFTRAVFATNYAEQKEAALAAANAQKTKEALKRQTEEAASRGLFGAPSFTVGDELFWGNDRLEAALAWATAKSKDFMPGLVPGIHEFETPHACKRGWPGQGHKSQAGSVRSLARCFTLALFSCPQAAMMSRPRGERTGLA